MSKAKISKKYQIVVPKKIRQQMNLKAGNEVELYSLDEDRAILVKHPKDPLKRMRGLGKELWASLGGADTYIKEERSSWQKR
ncbi:MAG: AbrB/MazE/SpoVT family DNA-binding domain-containing protein [Candidatus Harrisonbacteria bacterium]|nr:AbrB/MazE/SpoVT family DNA-binding domain-containing protein [Candidatus Harrisonbacteria bacterium]